MDTVQDVMTIDIHYCTPLDNVYEVAVMMKEYGVGAVPICENGNILGLITDRDIAIRGVGSKRPGSTKVTDIMSDNLITVSPTTSIEAAADLMAEEQIRRLPVVEGKKLVGIVSLGDLANRKKFEHDASQALSEISENHGEWQH